MAFNGLLPGDEYLRALVAELLRLRVLKLCPEWRPSDGAFMLVGQQCRQLTHLELLADIDVLQLQHCESSAPLFPEIKTLAARDLGGSVKERWGCNTIC